MALAGHPRDRSAGYGGVRAPSHPLPHLRSPPTSPTRCTPRCTWAPTTAATRWPARTRSGSCCRGARTTTWPTPWRRDGTGAKGPRGRGARAWHRHPLQEVGGGRGSREPLYKCTNEGLLLFYVSSIITCIFPGTGPQRLSLPDPALVYFKSLYIGPPLPPPPTRGTSQCFRAGMVPQSMCQDKLSGAAAARADRRHGVTAMWGRRQRWRRQEGGRVGAAHSPALGSVPRLAPAAPLTEGPFSFPPQICCSRVPPSPAAWPPQTSLSPPFPSIPTFSSTDPLPLLPAVLGSA